MLSVGSVHFPYRVAAGRAVVPSPHPRSNTFNPGVMPSPAITASPLSRMLAAILVQLPLSQTCLKFGFSRDVVPSRAALVLTR